MISRRSTSHWRAALILCRSAWGRTCTAVHRARGRACTMKRPSSRFRERRQIRLPAQQPHRGDPMHVIRDCAGRDAHPRIAPGRSRTIQDHAGTCSGDRATWRLLPWTAVAASAAVVSACAARAAGRCAPARRQAVVFVGKLVHGARPRRSWPRAPWRGIDALRFCSARPLACRESEVGCARLVPDVKKNIAKLSGKYVN